MRGVAQNHPEFRHCRGELQIRRRVLKLRAVIGERALRHLAYIAVRFLVTQFHRERFLRPLRINVSRRHRVRIRRLILQRIHRRHTRRRIGRACPGRHDFIQRRHRVARPDLARIHLVVIEIFLPQHPLLVSDQPVGGDPRRIEFHLDLHVFRDRHERPVDLLHENFARFIDRIEIGVIPVPFVGQLLHRRILQVVRADAEDAEEHAALRFGLD